MTTKKTNNTSVSGVLVAAACFSVLAAFALVLAIPASREAFKAASKSQPYPMGFVKFALLATVGEIFAIRIKKKQWLLPVKTLPRVLIWGLIGVAITFMMSFYTHGVVGMMSAGLLPGASEGFTGDLLRAFFTAALMNLSFGPVFMAFHKCTDKALDLRAAGEKASLRSVIAGVDWHGFVSFTLFKTIPLFWIPAHTLTFMLPEEYRVIVAAALSIALGIILSLKK